MRKETKAYFEKNGFELVEKKGVTQILLQGLHAFSISERKDGTFNITLNMIKRDPKAKLDLQSAQTKNIYQFDFDLENMSIKGIDLDTFKLIVVECWDVFNVVKELSEFRETQSDFELAVAEKEGKTLKWRSNLPTEKHIVEAVFLRNEYIARGLKLGKEDVVFDLGGNIGAFTVDVADKVKKVVVFEPEDVNFEFLSVNVEDNELANVLRHKQAVVGNDDKTRDLYLGKVPYYYSFLVKQNRKRVPVECVNINAIMKMYKPTKLKVDIEGSEWEVLINCEDFGRVNQLVFEYNFDMNGDLKGSGRFRALTEHLRKHGFDVKPMEIDFKQNWNLVFLVNRKIK